MKNFLFLALVPFSASVFLEGCAETPPAENATQTVAQTQPVDCQEDGVTGSAVRKKTTCNPSDSDRNGEQSFHDQINSMNKGSAGR